MEAHVADEKMRLQVLLGTCSWTDPTLVACGRFYPNSRAKGLMMRFLGHSTSLLHCLVICIISISGRTSIFIHFICISLFSCIFYYHVTSRVAISRREAAVVLLAAPGQRGGGRLQLRHPRAAPLRGLGCRCTAGLHLQRQGLLPLHRQASGACVQWCVRWCVRVRFLLTPVGV